MFLQKAIAFASEKKKYMGSIRSSHLLLQTIRFVLLAML